MRCALLRIGFDELAKALGLPDDVRIMSATLKLGEHAIYLEIEGGQLPEALGDNCCMNVLRLDSELLTPTEDGKPHAQQRQEQYAEMAAQNTVLLVRGAVGTLAHTFYGNAAKMEKICELLAEVGMRKRGPTDPELGNDVERVLRE